MANTGEIINKNMKLDFTCKVIPVDRRKHQRPEKYEDERNDEKCFITESTLDNLIKHVEQKMLQQKEDIRFAHNKKFIILGSTFTLLTLIASFIIGLADAYKPNMTGTTITGVFISLTLFILIISAVNFSIIKYLIDLKLVQIIALRGLNCSRQSLHAMLFAKIEGKLPKRLPIAKVEDKEAEADLAGTILDRTTKFWEIYGKHEKYPLNNVQMRERYLQRVDNTDKFIPQKNLWFKSSDIFPVYVIVVFTCAIILSPIVAFLFEVGSLGLPSYLFMLIGALALAWCAKFLHMVKKIVDTGLEQIVSKLKTDETFRLEEYQKNI